MTSAQLGHWSNVVTFLGNNVSPASLHCNRVCNIRRDMPAVSSWEVERRAVGGAEQKREQRKGALVKFPFT